MPAPSALHTNARLSQLSVEYSNPEYIWNQLFPVVKVNKRSDLYTVYNKESKFRVYDDYVNANSSPNQVDWNVSTDNYSVRSHALADYVSQEEQDNADVPIQPMVDTNDFLNSLLDIAQEQRVATKTFTVANYGTNKVTLSGTGQWGQSADDPIGSMLTAVESCFVRANVIVMGQAVWEIYRKLPEILDAVKASSRFQTNSGGLATQDEIANLFGVQKVLVGRARVLTNKEGQTNAYARLWGKHAVAMYVAPSIGIKTLTFGATFSESLRQTQTMFDPTKGEKGSTYVKVAWNSDEKIIAADCGYMIENAVP